SAVPPSEVRSMHRRDALRTLGAGAVGGLTASAALASAPPPRARIKQSICRWCYGRFPLKRLADEAVRIGYRSIELLTPAQFLETKDGGLPGAVSGGADIANGFTRPANHARLVKELEARIDFAAEHRLPNVICMSGNRAGMDDDEGMKNCAAGLKRI